MTEEASHTVGQAPLAIAILQVVLTTRIDSRTLPLPSLMFQFLAIYYMV